MRASTAGLLGRRGRPPQAGPADDQREDEPEEGERPPSHDRLVSPTRGRPSPASTTQRLERRRDLATQRADLRAVILVGDRAGAMVELELLERRERTVARFEQLEPTLLVLVEIVRARRTPARARVGTEARPRRRRRRRAPQRARERGSTCRRGGRPRGARATSLRCSRRSGHSVISEPRRKTRPASQMRLTSGLTKTRK